MAEKNPFEFNRPEWIEKYSRDPLVLLREKTHDEIPNNTKIASFSDFNLEKIGILSLLLRDNNGYSSELSISRYPDEKIRLEYTKNGKTNILGEVNGEERIQKIEDAFIEFKRSNNPDKVDHFLAEILDNTEFENQGNSD